MVVVERAQRELGAAHHPGEQMPPLSPEELNGLKEELAAGTTPTVWFTAAAVGVPEGRSGKVIALADPEEGDFIQVRPAGSKDVVSFSAADGANTLLWVLAFIPPTAVLAMPSLYAITFSRTSAPPMLPKRTPPMSK